MSQLSELVNKYYPQEKVEKDIKTEFSTSLNTILGNKADFFGSNPLKISFVETNSMLFFDIRPIYYSYRPWLSKLNPINIFISLFIIICIPIVLFNFIRDISKTSPAFIVLILVIIIPLFIVILRWNKTITNILTIKKSWIVKDELNAGTRKITWSMPENEFSFSFVHLLSDDKKKNLSFLLKLQSGVYFKKLYNTWFRKTSPVDFQNVVFEIKE